MPTAVIYARVSSKDQEKEGYSIPAQLELLRGYAADHGLSVLSEFVDVETAKQAGRSGFGAMIDLLEANPSCRIVLVEKTDRLYRNLKDWVTVDDLGLEVHFVKENVVLSPESRSSEKFMHGIKVLMAKNYIDNLSEESRKGMLEKARQGIWPSYAPLGYLNVQGVDGKRTIQPDPDLAPIIRIMYERYATGRYSLKELSKVARADGLAYRKSGTAVPTSTIHKILRNRIYSGDFDFGGTTYRGTYEPIVSRDLWQQVQSVLDGRGVKKTRTKRFAFSGMVTCGHCGRAMVGELKKGRYVYYHCSECAVPYTREEALEQAFTALVAEITFSDEMLALAAQAVDEGARAEREQHASAVDRLQREHRRLEERIEAMYVDKLDGTIEQTVFDRKAAEWRVQQTEIAQQIEEHESVERGHVTDVRHLAQQAVELFAQQPAHEKRKLLDYVISGCAWKDGKLTPHWRVPWEEMVREEQIAA